MGPNVALSQENVLSPNLNRCDVQGGTDTLLEYQEVYEYVRAILL